MVTYFLFTIAISILSILGYRYSFPYPFKEYTAVFLFLFFFAFIPNLFHRNWGRIFTIVGAMILVRIGSFGNLLTTIPDWTTLHPLFLGACSGILAREFVLTKNSANRSFPWKSIELGFLFFLGTLGLERFLSYHPWSFSEGIRLEEGFYYENLSYRQAFQLSWMQIDSLLSVIFYFFLENSLAGEKEKPSKDWIFGMGIAFMIHGLVFVIQNWLVPTAFMQDTNRSLIVGRSAGLFKDSGSASWIYPTLGIFLFWQVWKKKGQWLEKHRILVMFGIMTLTVLAGVKLGRTFWLVLIPSVLCFAVYPLWIQKISSNLWVQYGYRFTLVTSLSILCFSVLWFGENQSHLSALNRASREMKVFLEGNSLDSIDSHRTQLIKASWEMFESSPLFGSGFGSMITHLKNPQSIIQSKPKDGFVDSPANFYLGWLGEVGILGWILLGFFLFASAKNYQNGKYYLLMVLPLMTGYQIVHSDGGFFLLFLILGTATTPYTTAYLQKQSKWKNLGMILFLGIGLHYIVWALLKN